MITFQQLYEAIPKLVEQWTEQQVLEWFRLNEIQISENATKLTGKKLIKLTPQQMALDLRLSHFIIRKLCEWIQFEVKDYDEYVMQKREDCQEKESESESESSESQNKYQQQQLQEEEEENSSSQQCCFQQKCNQNGVKQKLIFDYKSQSLISAENEQQSENDKLKSDRFSSQILIQNESTQIYNPQKYQLQKDSRLAKKEKQNNNIQKCFSSSRNPKGVQNSLFTKKTPIIGRRMTEKQQKKKKKRKSPLELNGMLENSESSEQEQIETCQHIPTGDRPEKNSEYFSGQESQMQSIHMHPLTASPCSGNVGSKLMILQQSPLLNPAQQNPSMLFNNSPIRLQKEVELLKQQSDYYSKNVQFISSHLTLAGNRQPQQLQPSNTLLVYYADQCLLVEKPVTKIGRSTVNDIVLKCDGVSRSHAQLLMCERQNFVQNDQQLQKKGYQQIFYDYYICDVGSKFGTFVEVNPQKPRRVQQGEHYSVGSTTIRIDKIKLYKNKEKFDLTLCLGSEEEQIKSYYARSNINVGKKRKEKDQQTKRSKDKLSSHKLGQSKDIELQDGQIKPNHCRFVLLNNQLHLQQVQGNILEKLVPNQKFPLTRNHYSIKFGEEYAQLKMENPLKLKGQWIGNYDQGQQKEQGQ